MPGGARPGAGRPKGSKDSPLVLTRALTAMEAKAIRESAEVAREQARLAAWEALGQQIKMASKMTVRERTAVIDLALRYSEPPAGTAAAAAARPADPAPSAAELVRANLRRVADGFPPEVLDAQRRREIAAVPEITDAEIVERREA
jgi:hypothetical protein